MSNFKNRVRKEHRKLGENVQKLTDFIATDMFDELPENERLRLNMQQFHMNAYLQILSQRLVNNFE